MGPAPQGAFNMAAWQMIRDIVCADPQLTEAAWEELRGVAGILPDTDVANARAASGSGYFEF